MGTGTDRTEVGRGEFLKPGDVVKLWIEKIGSLTNTMV
jgi:2-keto-4-pentenoate hydratase/2-oxohepta-3-ene-1,7-dioic acid hydratase in catechol pathway